MFACGPHTFLYLLTPVAHNNRSVESRGDFPTVKAAATRAPPLLVIASTAIRAPATALTSLSGISLAAHTATAQLQPSHTHRRLSPPARSNHRNPRTPTLIHYCLGDLFTEHRYYQRPVTSQLPLTPPDSGSGYYSSMNYSQDLYQQPVSQTRHDSAYDYQQGYMQPAVAPAPPTYQFHQGAFQPTTSLQPIQNFYEPVGAPILPPLRINDRLSFTDDYQRRLQQQEQQNAAAREQQRQASKEEKATGGVSAKLDYDMERMTDFVTDATASIFQHSMQSHPSFRKWVHQVLSATRLPSATILLSLHYLNDRLCNFPDSVVAGENQIYRLLAVALILGSKFLDDNTFINRSWSDVTAIKVTELNKLEMAWLALFEWRLHVDPLASNGLQAWIESWKKYDAELCAKQLERQAQQAQQLPARLSPLDTNVHRHTTTTTSRDRFSPYPTPHTATSTRAYEQPFSARSTQYSTPYSAADPWASSSRQVDDYYKRPARYESYADIEEANRRASEERARQTAYQYGNSQAYYQTPTYPTGWDHANWNTAHRYDCNCSTCAYSHHYRPYPLTSGYTAQTVMG
ncbi:hypothetical protein AC579_7512 [Pseudocercospora musae]|uniref:Cyclin N-terminal domain-containing protein n=1 Tax=Pseudocercospora musae TaxID=113226 RepID=A0A139H4N7_9PEZI|nr:hypothetical protein AC579_7512 [Pseudocercospora musae]